MNDQLTSENPLNDLKPEIGIDDLEKIDIRVGTVLNAERVGGSVKLIKLEVDLGPLGVRTILTGMQEFFTPEDFIGVQTTFVVNLKPRKMMGMESHGMFFAIDSPGINGEEGRPEFLLPRKPVNNGDPLI